MRHPLALFALLAAVPAAAVPLELTHTGRLADNAGTPLEGQHSLDLALYADEAGTSRIWSGADLVVTFTDGYFSVVIGADGSLDEAVLDGQPAWLGLAVDDGAELTPRLPLRSVPYAIRAHAVSGGPVDASELRVAGQRVVGSDGALALPLAWSRLTAVPADLADGDGDTLASLACGAGELAGWNGSAWACVTGGGGSGSVNATDLVGTIPLDNLPIGTGANQVAPGDHAHSFGQITGQAAFTQLPVGTDANQVAAGNHTHTAAEVGAIPAGGGVPVGAATTCNTSANGTLRWAAGALEVCLGTTWQPIQVGRDGRSAATAATHCRDLKARYPELPDGRYWINPSLGAATAAFEAWCDMTTSGGGWTLVISQTSLPTTNMADRLDAAVPTPTVEGVRGWWLKNDLKLHAAEIKVRNTSGEENTFLTADFTGPLIVDAPNWVDAGNQAWNGIMAGNNFPVVTHYQVGQACTSASCRLAAGSSNSYSYGLAIIFDWHNGEGGVSVTQHAHFGGNANIETSWARRGQYLWVR